MAQLRLPRLPTLLFSLWLGVSLGAFSRILAQRLGEMKPAAGRLLVANRQMRDPRFAESVILLVRYGEEGALGVIINRPSKVKLAELLPDAAQLKDRPDPVYIGGPVARDGMMLLLRSEEKPEGAKHVFADVYVSPSREVLDRLVAADDRNFRAYVGYAGWAAGQLEYELERQDWHVLPGDADMVFAEDTESVWDKLIQQTEMLFAGLGQSELNGFVDSVGSFVRLDMLQPLLQAALEITPRGRRRGRPRSISN